MDPAQQLSLKEPYGGTLTFPVSACVNIDADGDELWPHSDFWWFIEVLVPKQANFVSCAWTPLARILIPLLFCLPQ